MSQNSKLTALGIDVDKLSAEQHDVLAGLSAEEVSVLASVKQRLEAASGDVEGHSAAAETPVIGGVLF